MPGMAASPKIFELIVFPPQYKIIYLKWIKPNVNETIKYYGCQNLLMMTSLY